MHRNLDLGDFGGAEECCTSLGGLARSDLSTASEGAFPYDDDSPPQRSEHPFDPFISGTVALDLLSPEICSRRGNLGSVALVPVPEAAMNEDYSSVLC